MRQNALTYCRRSAVAAVILAIFSTQDASAQSRVRGEYAQSQSPLYQVGDYNGKLSALCRRGMFKQRKILLSSIGYTGKKGMGVTGIAKVGYNLYDPTGAGDPTMTYHFFSQGYSNCRVYEALTPPPQPGRP